MFARNYYSNKNKNIKYVKSINQFNKNIIKNCVILGNLRGVELFLRFISDTNSKMIDYAVQRNRLDIVHYLIKNGYKLYDTSHLFVSATNNYISMTKYCIDFCIKNNIDINHGYICFAHIWNKKLVDYIRRKGLTMANVK